MVLAVYPYKTSHPLPPPRLLLLKFILLIIRTNPWREQNCIISRRIDYKKNVFCELWYIENQSLFFLHITDIILRDFLKTRFSRCVAQCRDWYRLKPVFFLMIHRIISKSVGNLLFSYRPQGTIEMISPLL